MHKETTNSTTMLPIDPEHPQADRIHRAARIIQAGGLVAFPTETVYGLGADAFNTEAVTQIFTAKGRPAYDPIIVHVDQHVVSQPERLEDVVAFVSPTASLLIQTFWPGALTLVLPKSDRIPAVVTANGPTVAVRCPRHPIAQALIYAAGCPIAAPSANRFSHTSPTTAQHVFDDLHGRVELILDGGPTSIGVESTVLDLSGDRPRLLRPGGVSLEALEAVLGPIEQPGVSAKNHEPLASPGMLDRHYAPKAMLLLFTGSNDGVQDAISARAANELAIGHKVGLLVADEDAARLSTLGCPQISVGPQADAETIARRLFDAMRTLDDAGVELILARDFAPQGLGLAIRDRLRRAAEHIVQVDQ
jgi:L-threonylcarbamoyladenylate synthase